MDIRYRAIGFALLAGILSAAPAMASSFQAGDQVSALYTSPVNGTIVTVNNSGNSETAYADPYNVTITDLTQNIVLMTEGMCFNADANIVPPNPWNAQVVSATQLATAYFVNVLGKNGVTAAADAEMIAYLDSAWGQAVSQNTATAQFTEEIGIAEWEVTGDFDALVGSSSLNLSAGSFRLGTSGSDTHTQTSLLSDPSLTGPSGLLANAYASYVANTPLSSYSGLFLVPEQTGSYQPQQIQPFALLPPPSGNGQDSVPEPSSIVMLGIGALGLVFPLGMRSRKRT